jgi:hypothetical protein
MVFGTGGAAGFEAGTGLVGVEAALAALGSATLTEEDDGDFDAGLSAAFTVGLAAGLSINLTTGFITDLDVVFFSMTSLVVDFLAGTAALTAVFSAGLTATLTATLAGVLLFLAGAFTSCLLWAVACG